MNLLLTGFGPFPGALFNPTGPLVETLARGRKLPGVRRTPHVFQTSYAAVDRELPLLLAREKPDVLVMFGLANKARHLRVETLARNALGRVIPDAAGMMPRSTMIIPGAGATLAMRTPAQRLVMAARTAGVQTMLSRDAGNYLCNYLCWYATRAAAQPDGPAIAAFVHVPKVRGLGGVHQAPLTIDDLVRAGEAIVLAAAAAVRTMR